MIKTAYFPSISMMNTMILSGEICIDAAEHFQKNSLRNRCYLASSQGKVLISVPLRKGKHQQMPIRDVQISYDFDWPGLHRKTMENNYKKAPFYSYFKDEIDHILRSKPKFLIDLNWQSLVFICNTLQWKPSMSYSLEFEARTESIKPVFAGLPYPQLFEPNIPFIADLSILDLFFCVGPQLKFIAPSGLNPNHLSDIYIKISQAREHI